MLKFIAKLLGEFGVKTTSDLTQEVHNKILARVILALVAKYSDDPEGLETALTAILAFKGLGGNASQFKQYLAKLELITASTSSGGVNAKVEDLLADLEG